MTSSDSPPPNVTAASTHRPRSGHAIPPRQPNIIWLFGDQHRAQALSCAGDPNVHTPSIDSLAAGGVTFTRAVSGFPLCCSFRASLLSGRYPHRCVPGHEKPFPDGMPTVAKPFKDAGYHTAWFGKWHIDGFAEKNGRAAWHIVPPHRRGGFDTWVGYENNNSQTDCWVHGHEDGSEVPLQRLPGFETDCLTDRFIEYLGRQAGQDGSVGRRPFFAALSVQPPHDPYIAPRPWMERHHPTRLQLRPNVPPIALIQEQARRELAGYYALIENLDWNIGRIVDALHRLDLWEDTYIVFLSDHGDMHGSHGHFRKLSPYAESMHIPAIISGGDRYTHRIGRVPVPINHVDFAPTSLALAGIQPPDWMEGTSYAHRFVGEQHREEPGSAYVQVNIPTGHGPSIRPAWRGVVTEDGWKYIALEGQPWMLFHMDEDPYELNNMALVARNTDKARELNELTRSWVERTGDRFRLPKNEDFTL